MHSLTGKRWRILRSTPFAASDDIAAILALDRGIDKTFHELSSPSLFPEMGTAVQRIRSAVAKKEVVGIFGDYDADGITGVAQIVRYFRRHGSEPIVYLPHREKDGYGMKEKSVRELASKGVTLLITVDTGIAAHAEITLANSLGMEVIITDHHRERDGRPAALAVLHPRVPKPFPNPHLCGSGVAFMLVRALEEGNWSGAEEDLLLATIGTIGDLVPLVGENRVLVQHGLRVASALPPGTLKTFIDEVRGKAAQLKSADIAYRVVPRINASGRMDHPQVALDALLGDIAAIEKLHQLNVERQELTEKYIQEAQTMVDVRQAFLCIASPTFTPGVIGLVAGNLAENYGRPALVASVTPQDVCTASIRSIPSFDVSSALADPTVSRLLTSFGGHAQAAGCTFPYSAFQELSIALSNTVAQQGMTHADLVPTMHLDAEFDSAHLTLKTAASLNTLEPFGQGNREPLFLLRNQTITDARAVGSAGTHLSCRVGKTKAIGFGLAELLPNLDPNQKFDVACSLSINVWNGREEIQLFVKDISPTH